MWFFAWQEIEDYCKRARTQDFPMVLFWILTFFFGIVGLYTYPVVQMRLNDAHRAATNGQATDAPMRAADWIAIVVGGLFALWLLIIIVDRGGQQQPKSPATAQTSEIATIPSTRIDGGRDDRDQERESPVLRQRLGDGR